MPHSTVLSLHKHLTEDLVSIKVNPVFQVRDGRFGAIPASLNGLLSHSRINVPEIWTPGLSADLTIRQAASRRFLSHPPRNRLSYWSEQRSE